MRLARRNNRVPHGKKTACENLVTGGKKLIDRFYLGFMEIIHVWHGIAWAFWG